MVDFYKSKKAVDEYIELAKNVNGQELIDRLQLFLPKGARVLEVGSGPGTDWRLLCESYNVVGSDNSDEFLKHLVKNNPQGRFLQLDAVSLNSAETFDCLYSNKVLHHLTDDELRASISRQVDILHHDGLVCHSFWKGEGNEEFKGMFVNYHTKDELVDFFGRFFEIVLLEEYQEFEPDDSLLLIARKQVHE